MVITNDHHTIAVSTSNSSKKATFDRGPTLEKAWLDTPKDLAHSDDRTATAQLAVDTLDRWEGEPTKWKKGAGPKLLG